MAVKTEPRYVGDLVLSEWDERGTRKSARVENDTGGPLAMTIGTVLEFDSDHYQPADGTSFGGILLKNLESLDDSGGIDNIPILYQGPAIINRNLLVWDDGATQADVVEAMEALHIVLVDEPTNTEEG